MYIKEMHIEVNQSLQKIAANITRKFYSDEVDWILNKVQERFIRSRVHRKSDGSGGFEIDELGADDIQTLVVSQLRLPAYKDLTITEDSADEETSENAYTSPLPGNYWFLLSDSSNVGKLCNGATRVLNTTSRTILWIPFKYSTKGSAPYYVTAILSTSSDLFSIASRSTAFGGTWTGVPRKEQIWDILDAMRSQLFESGTDLWFEYFFTTYKPRQIAIEAPSGSITIDSIASDGVPQVYNLTLATLGGSTPVYQWQTNRLTATNKVENLLGTAYYDTSGDSPISELKARTLKVYANKSFIVQSTRISYIRKPRRMSLILNSDCELPETAHQSVCDLAVEYIKAMIADPNWEVKLKDNMTRTTI